MKGYWIILGAEVTDLEAQQEYGRLWQPIAQKYDAQLKMLGAEVPQESWEPVGCWPQNLSLIR
jgi:hypothetical protein